MTVYFARLDHLHSIQSQMCGLKGVGMGLGMTAVTGLSRSEGKMVEQDPGGNWVHQGDEQIAYGCCDQCDQRKIEDSQDENMEALAAVVQE